MTCRPLEATPTESVCAKHRRLSHVRHSRAKAPEVGAAPTRHRAAAGGNSREDRPPSAENQKSIRKRGIAPWTGKTSSPPRRTRGKGNESGSCVSGKVTLSTVPTHTLEVTVSTIPLPTGVSILYLDTHFTGICHQAIHILQTPTFRPPTDPGPLVIDLEVGHPYPVGAPSPRAVPGPRAVGGQVPPA